MTPLWLWSAFCFGILVTASDFYYPNFNDTAGLRLNGDAATSDCQDGGAYEYNAVHGENDASDAGEEVEPILSEDTTEVTERSSRTHTRADARRTPKYFSAFPHRDLYGLPPDAFTRPCPVRLRLTPARPYKIASVARLQPLSVLKGWETRFTFQLSDAAQQCSYTKDAAAGTRSYKTCTVTGGDGFAFVIHGDEAGSGAMGTGGGGLGYAGLRNAIALEFDTWYNSGGEGDRESRGVGVTAFGPSAGMSSSGPVDIPYDHIALQASPAAGEGVPTYLTAGPSTRVAPPKRAELGDGLVHLVRVVYWPHIKYDLLPHFSAGNGLLQHLGGLGEDRRIGTLAVYLDGEAAADPASGDAMPLLALPINLNAALRLPEDQAFVGFTASTGTSWQKHDILSWYWCDVPGCPRGAAEGSDVLYYNTTGATLPDAGR